MKAIKISWIKRYSIDKINDNWADIIDSFYQLTPDTRHTIHNFGPERFNKIIKANIPVISTLFSAYKIFRNNFPTCPSTLDNSWLNQCAFYNMNFTRKQPNSNKTTFLTPTFYGIPDTFHTLTIKDLHLGGTFITNVALNQLTNSTIMDMQYKNLRKHIRAHIGQNKKYDAIAMEIIPQKIFTYSTPIGLLKATKTGSGKYRKIMEKNDVVLNIHSPAKWRKKLGEHDISDKQVKKSLILLHSPYLDSTGADHIARLKLGKTLFNNQLFAIGLLDENNCNTCIREYNQEETEDYKHALFHCPAVQDIIHNITCTFFPNINNTFKIAEILISSNTDKHSLYKGVVGRELANLVWIYFQIYIIQCRTLHKTPVAATAIFEIREQLNRILKILPKSKISIFIRSSQALSQIIRGTGAENTGG